MAKNRIYYKPRCATLNGRYITSLRDVGMTIEFELTQCFCSCCTWPLKSMREEYKSDIYVCYDDCPNAKPWAFLRYATKKELSKYRKDYRKERENTKRTY